MKKKNKDLFMQFNLPGYVQGKSFADASKAIQNKFKDRTDKEAKETEMELLGRLRDAQEFTKQQEQGAYPGDQAIQQGVQEHEQQGQFALGGYTDPTEPNGEVKVSPERAKMASQVQEVGPMGTELTVNRMGQYAPTQDNYAIRAQAKIDRMKGNPYAKRRAQMDLDREIKIRAQRTQRKANVANFQDDMGNLENPLAQENLAQQARNANMGNIPEAQQLTQSGYAMGGYSNTNDYFLGGLFGGNKEQQEQQGQGPGAAGIANMASSALDMGQTAFGNNNDIDTSGMSAAPAKQNQAAGAVGGAMKGAQAGMALGPWGAAAGAVLGGVTSLIGGNKRNKKIAEAQREHTYAQVKNVDNPYAKGGYTNDYPHGGPHDPNDLINRDRVDSTFNQPIDALNQDASAYGSRDLNANYGFTDYTKGDANLDGLNDAEQSKFAEKTLSEQGVGGAKDILKKAGQWGKDHYQDIMRLAPIGMNAYQLAKLEKPEHEGLDKLGNRYQKQLVDEEQLQNKVREQSANFRNAILGASGGSGAAARANLLGSQVNQTRALSEAYQAAEDRNRSERTKEQEFNLGVDRVNLQQSNMEKDINARNLGNYQTQKSKLLAELGTNIGEVGREELYKKYPEMMGMYYDSKGRLIQTEEQKKKKKSKK